MHRGENSSGRSADVGLHHADSKVCADYLLSCTNVSLLCCCCLHVAVMCSVGSAVTGAALLCYSSHYDWVTPALGLFTIWLYAHPYTSLKRLNERNTELGAIVGALPVPIGFMSGMAYINNHMMAEHGLIAVNTLNCLHLPHVLLGTAVLFAWQMQHFMVICWKYRAEYAAAGYHMASRNDAQGKR